MPLPLQVAFVAGSSGIWRIERITAVAGEILPPAERLAVIEGPDAQRPLEGSWILRSTTSNSYRRHKNSLISEYAPTVSEGLYSSYPFDQMQSLIR
jgi:hypothetical protein